MPIEAMLLSHRRAAAVVFDEKDLAALSAYGTILEVAAGEFVGRAGTVLDRIIVVREGEVEFTARNAVGRRVVVALAQAGRPIGDIPFLLRQPMRLDAIARERSTLIVIDHEKWLQILAESPALTYRWMGSVARRLDADRRRLMILTTRSLPSQVAFLILEQVHSDGHAPITHVTLAGMLGARRQSVTRVLAQLRDDGLVSTSYGDIRVVDWSGLLAMVGSDLYVRLPEGVLPGPTTRDESETRRS